MVMSANPSLFPPLAHVLIAEGILSADESSQIVASAKSHDLGLITYLLEQRILSAHTIAQACAHFFNKPYYELNQLTPPILHLLHKYPLFRDNLVLPLEQNSQSNLLVAISDPQQLGHLPRLSFYTGLAIHFHFVEHDKLTNFLNQATADSQASLKLSPDMPSTNNKGHQTQTERLFNAENWLDQVFEAAIHQQASDIHLEPRARDWRIRFRIDGLLQPRFSLSADYANAVISRIKLLAQLNIAEKRLPQDGHLSIKTSTGWSREARINTIPNFYGEKLAIRLLENNSRKTNLAQLGMLPSQHALLMQMIQKPQGLILITGPTGSGKTSTLYGILQALNNSKMHIVTLEDPIEMALANVNQITIQTNIGFTFSAALRAVLRQDPDIIMLGEIRDRETAEIAIQAANTGHLVLASLHTQNAATTLMRLLHFGISTLQIATCIQLIVAQRLLRRLCSLCKQLDHTPVINAKTSTVHALPDLAAAHYYCAQGCDQCNEGYHGRVGIFEMLPIDDSIAELLTQRPSHLQLQTIAQQQGMVTLLQAAQQKATDGETSLAEIRRVLTG